MIGPSMGRVSTCAAALLLSCLVPSRPALAQKDSAAGAGGWPSAAQFLPGSTVCTQSGNQYTIGGLVDLYNNYGQWETLQAALTQLVQQCVPSNMGLPTPSVNDPVLVTIAHDKSTYSVLLPEHSQYNQTLHGVGHVRVIVIIDQHEMVATEPTDFKLVSSKTPNPLEAQIPDLVKSIVAANIGGLGPIIRGLSEDKNPPPPPPLPPNGLVLFVSREVPLPFTNATITETGTVRGQSDEQAAKVSATFVNKAPKRVEFTAVAGALVGSLKGAEKMKVDNGKYASNPLSRGLTMAAVAYHPSAYDDSSSGMSRAERFSLLLGGLITPAPGLGGGLSFGIVRGLAINAGAALMWVPTAAGDAKPGDAAASGSKQLVYSWNSGFFVGGGYVFK